MFKYMFYALSSMYWNKKADVQQGCVLKPGHLCCLIPIGENVELTISAYSSLNNSYTVFNTGQLSYFDSERQTSHR